MVYAAAAMTHRAPGGEGMDGSHAVGYRDKRASSARPLRGTKNLWGRAESTSLHKPNKKASLVEPNKMSRCRALPSTRLIKAGTLVEAKTIH